MVPIDRDIPDPSVVARVLTNGITTFRSPCRSGLVIWSPYGPTHEALVHGHCWGTDVAIEGPSLARHLLVPTQTIPQPTAPEPLTPSGEWVPDREWRPQQHSAIIHDAADQVVYPSRDLLHRLNYGSLCIIVV